MFKHSRTALVAMGILLVAVAGTAFAQVTEETKSQGKRKMSDKEHMAMMDKMSVADKAAMMDKMSMKDMAAMKLHGTEASSMTEQEHTAMMAKMPEQDKADMFDKIPMEKRMAMMRKHSMKHKENMEKTHKN